MYENEYAYESWKINRVILRQTNALNCN